VVDALVTDAQRAAVTSGCLYLVGTLSHGTERVDLGVEVARICRGHVRVLGARAPAHVVTAGTQRPVWSVGWSAGRQLADVPLHLSG